MSAETFSRELYIKLIKKWHPRLANISWLYLPHRRGGNRQLVQSAKADQLTQETTFSSVNRHPLISNRIINSISDNLRLKPVFNAKCVYSRLACPFKHLFTHHFFKKKKYIGTVILSDQPAPRIHSY